jgi:hypothetical protein
MYGQAGTQVSVVTRGGTNRIHGSLFEYRRGNELQARSPFAIGEAAPYLRNQFGGSFGGPVMLPRFNGRNRSFFFLNYEGSRESQTDTRVSTVPLDAFWKGDFSSLLARGVQLKDPIATGRPNIPGNRLDEYLGGARISAAAQKLQPFWGSPNVPGLTNNSVRNADASSTIHQFTTRFDQQLPHNQSLALRLTHSIQDAFTSNLIGNGSGLLRPTSNWNGSVTWIGSFSAHVVNELRFSVADMDSVTRYFNANLPTSVSLGIQGFSRVSDLFPPLPRITFAGGDAFTQLNYGGDANFGMAALLKGSRTYTPGDTLTVIRGAHTIRAGFEMRKTNLPTLQQSTASGALSYTASATGVSTGYGFADFLMGLPSSAQQVPPKPPVLLHQNNIASFVQDDWRISSRLSISLGIRHEVHLSPTEEKNRMAMFDPVIGGIVVASDSGRLPVDQYLPAVVEKLAPQGTFPFPVVSDKQAGVESGRLVSTHYKYFAPRVGFAYSVGASRKTILRGGYGIFYTRYPIQYLQQSMFVNPPFAGLFTYSQSLQNGQPALTFLNPYPAIGGSPSVAPVGLERDFGMPYNQQWNLAVERQLGANTALTLGYVGNKGTHLFRTSNANGPQLDPVTKLLSGAARTMATR